MKDDKLQHYGVKGMKWGVRRYQPYPKGQGHKGKFLGKTRTKIDRYRTSKSKKVARKKLANIDQSKQVDNISEYAVSMYRKKKMPQRQEKINIDEYRNNKDSSESRRQIDQDKKIIRKEMGKKFQTQIDNLNRARAKSLNMGSVEKGMEVLSKHNLELNLDRMMEYADIEAWMRYADRNI